jgi:hypothetical protein
LDYHKTYLKLLKDGGILDTTQDEFWLKEFNLPGVEPAAPDQPLDAVVPPEQILGK